MTSANVARFNAEAAEWDSNVDVHIASEKAKDAILKHFPELVKQHADGTSLKQGLEVLEIGCGTGLLTLRISPYVREIVAVDASAGMINALEVKLRSEPEPNSLEAGAAKNITPLCILLEDPDDPDGPRRRFDLVLCHLVLHHIPDLTSTLAMMFGCLKPGGYIALTDFEDFGPEARRFHAEAKMNGVERDGIKRDWIRGLIENAGFTDVKVEEAFRMSKEVERFPGEWGERKPKDGNEEMEFPFLICLGKRP